MTNIRTRLTLYDSLSINITQFGAELCTIHLERLC